jgi:hypothetical protein
MNEHDVVVFHNYKILVVSDNESDCSDDSDDDYLEYTELVQDDIYSEDHPWDTRERSYRFRPDIWLTDQELQNFSE